MSSDALSTTRLSEVPVAVVDLEFTGLSPVGDRICEVAVVLGRGGVVEWEYQTLVRAGVRMSESARRCHGLADRELARAPRFADVADDVRRWLSGRVVVAHNVDFDLGFLHRAFEEIGAPLAPPFTLDTLLVARRLFAFPKNGLADVARELEVDAGPLHRALSDARTCWRVLGAMVARLDPTGALTLREISDLLGALAPNSPLRLEQLHVLRTALDRGTSVWLEYQSSSDPVAGLVAREVDPWFLQGSKLQGWCHLRQSERVFRLDRIRRVTLGERPVSVPADAVRRV